MYADDMILITDNSDNMVELIRIVNQYCNQYEIKINVSKTKYMVIDRYQNSKSPLKIGNEQLIPVDEMRYLGFMLNTKVDANTHLSKRRLACINRMYSLNNFGLNNPNLKTEIKASLIQQYCYPILFYNIENATVTTNQIEDLDSCASRMLKRVHHLQNKCKNNDLHYACNQTPILDLIKQRKLEFFLRAYSNNTTRKMLTVSNASRIVNKNRTKRNLLDEIYEICGIDSEDPILLKQLVLSVNTKLCEIKDNIQSNRESHRSKKLKKLISDENWAQLELELTPPEIIEWQRRKEIELAERIRVINELMREEEEATRLSSAT